LEGSKALPGTNQEITVITTSPYGAHDRRGWLPMDAEEPEATTFCCFFRSMESRADQLDRLRALATEPPVAEEAQADVTEDLAGDYIRSQRVGDAGAALEAAVRWWVKVKRRGYHAYSLKVGYGPYRTSCVIAFEELEPADIRFNFDRATEVLERGRSRVMDFFGFPGPG
jgi:hypothetical protein